MKYEARLATIDEIENWDSLVETNPGGGEVWAGSTYLGVKERQNRYTPIHVVLDCFESRSEAAFQKIAVSVLAKRVPLLGWWWSLSAGPAARNADEAIAAVAAISKLAAEQNVFMLKAEPRLPHDEQLALAQAGWSVAPRIIPNNSTVIVDLKNSEEDIFKSFNKKARNAINRAEREGLEVKRVPVTDENASAFYELLAKTADGVFTLRPRDYYFDFWKSFAHEGSGQLFFAVGDDGLVAGAYAMQLGSKTTYKDGASVREKTVYGASHALQWQVMRWAKEAGALSHDLCGAPRSDRAADVSDPLYGVGKFKRSFAPDITDYVGAFDIAISQTKTRIWHLVGERIARYTSLFKFKDPYY